MGSAALRATRGDRKRDRVHVSQWRRRDREACEGVRAHTVNAGTLRVPFGVQSSGFGVWIWRLELGLCVGNGLGERLNNSKLETPNSELQTKARTQNPKPRTQ